MNISSTILGIASLAFASVSFAFDSDEQRAAIDAQLGDTPSEQTYQNVFQSNPQLAPNILPMLLNKDGVNPQSAVEAAMRAAPNKALEIAQAARNAGVSNETITSGALLAGIDPTQIADATAAGIQTASAGPTPPSLPAVGGQGGGGTGVVSPN
ncbi:hypothetical protein D1115_17830 [Vibrio alfacsensis]|uniref:Uncharacterized protein n=1 Tax=Vibrio alfacsensis TaxID=1074311 RepID=A0ABM6YY76_9VIBR|nr:hypothetical protein [Vibrio alfacsensis]AXY02850.1 hypothetical protein D1115_17830 [Vibrio alfacsensis]